MNTLATYKQLQAMQSCSGSISFEVTIMSEFENHVFDVWNRFVRNMPCCPEDGCDRWCDGENILCKTYADAQKVADYIDEKAGRAISATGFYDPEEDKRMGCVDKYTGWYYVTI